MGHLLGLMLEPQYRRFASIKEPGRPVFCAWSPGVQDTVPAFGRSDRLRAGSGSLAGAFACGRSGAPCAGHLNPFAARCDQCDSRRMQATSDEALIERIAAGDKLAMHLLFARHHVRVYRFILRLLRDESVAEDLISEVF